MAKGKIFQTTISLGGKVDGSLTKALNASKSKAASAAKAISKSTTAGMNAANKAVVKSFHSMAAGALKLYGAVKAIAKLKEFASETITAAKAQLDVQTKLSSVLENVKSIQIRGPNAAADAAKELNKVADALENVGVIGNDITVAGMQQLATYQLSDKEISVLASGMDDLLAQTKGLNATQGDAVSVANMLGKAMSGSVGALSKVGISFTEAQEKAIKTGDATLRAATIAQVLKENVGGVNEAFAQTDQGQILQSQNTFDAITEEIGFFLLPLLNKLIKGALPYVQKALDKLTIVLDKLGPVISDQIDKGFDNFAKILPLIAQTIAVILPILEELLSPLSMGSDIIPMITGAIQSLLPYIATTVKTIAPLIPQLVQLLIPAFQSIVPAITNIINQALPLFISLIQALTPIVSDLVKELAPLIASLLRKLFPVIKILLPPILMLIRSVIPVLVSLIKLIAPVIADLIAQAAPLVALLMNALMPAMQMLLPPIISLIKSLLPVLQKLFGAIFSIIRALAPVISIVVQIFAVELLAAIKTLLPVVQGIIDHFINIIDVLTNVINFVVNIFTGNWSAAWENVKNIFAGIFKGFSDIAKAPLNWVIALINQAINGINGLTGIINKIPGVEIGEIPQIPYLAKGATVTSPTLAMIGEGKVPETVVPHNNTPRSRELLQEAARGVGLPIADKMSSLPIANKILNGLSYFADKFTKTQKNHKTIGNDSDTVTGPGKTYHIYFSPRINTKDAKGVKEVLDDEFEKFKQFVKQLRDEEGREVF